MAEYDSMILKIGELPTQDEQIPLTLGELTPKDRRMKYNSRYVKAMVSSDSGKYPDVLRLRYQRGVLDPKVWSIKIVEDLGELKLVPRPVGRMG